MSTWQNNCEQQYEMHRQGLTYRFYRKLESYKESSFQAGNVGEDYLKGE
jgi:hypothetical protein